MCLRHRKISAVEVSCMNHVRDYSNSCGIARTKKKPEGSTLPAFLTMANWILPRVVQTRADMREL